MILSQNSNKFHKLKRITKQGKVNVQHKVNWKNDYHIRIFLNISVVFLGFLADYKYPIFCKWTLQSLHKHKSDFQVLITCLTLSRRRPISYRNQSIHLLCKSMDKFLYDIGLRRERVTFINKVYLFHVGWYTVSQFRTYVWQTF